MKLILLADMHGDTRNMPKIAEAAADADGIIIAGDITNFGRQEDMLKILGALDVLDKPVWAVAGNCDLPAVEEVLVSKGISLHGQSVEFGGYILTGAGGSLPCPGLTPNEAGEQVFSKLLKKTALDFRTDSRLILVTHQPAYGISLDMTGSSRHTGSQSIREFIERYQPVLAVSGHMHEARGTDYINKTVCVNPGPFRQGYYAVAQLNGRKATITLCEI